MVAAPATHISFHSCNSESLWKYTEKEMEGRASRVLQEVQFNDLVSPFVDHSNGSFNFKSLSGGSGYKFGVLAKIVNYMKV